jgi:hypothetical protein
MKRERKIISNERLQYHCGTGQFVICSVLQFRGCRFEDAICRFQIDVDGLIHSFILMTYDVRAVKKQIARCAVSTAQIETK